MLVPASDDSQSATFTPSELGMLREGDVMALRPGTAGLVSGYLEPPRADDEIGRLGPYRVLKILGSGGMGRVFAGHDLTLDREVAIKILLPGADAERFVTESRITARLPHPGIPPVYALGTLPGGAHYLVMKLIRGRTLADLLQTRTSPREGLARWIDVFEQVAQAVGFAHAQGIIHRDLKPHNIMVGAFGEVQVMDWGLAKDLARQGSGLRETATEPARPPSLPAPGEPRPEHTAAGSILGTPGYMAPEQARGEAVDARADVFALGSILAAILTGRPAFAGLPTMDIIALSAAGDLTEALARLESCGADAELVTLARSCLAAQPADRPGDARQVAEDVAAYRAGVEARLRRAETEQTAALVRAAEQARRRRLLLVSAALVAVILVAGIVGTTFGLLEARREAEATELARKHEAQARAAEKVRADGEARAKQEADDQKHKAEAARDEANHHLNTLLGLVADIDYRKVREERKPLEAELAARLVEAVRQVEAHPPSDPLARARLQNRLGLTLTHLGNPEEAIPLFLKARAAFEAAGEPDALTAMNNLAVAYRGSGKPGLAVPLFAEVLKRRQAALGADHGDTLFSMNNLAMGLLDTGKIAQAVALYEQALKLSRASPTGESKMYLCLGNLAVAYRSAGKLDLALPLHEESVKLHTAKLGPDHPDTLNSMNNLAMGYLDFGKLDLAVPLLEETLRLRKARLGLDHRDTLMSMLNLAQGYRDVGKVNLAIPLATDALKVSKAKLGADHPDTLAIMCGLGLCYWSLGKHDLAIPLHEEALKLRKSTIGPDHPDTLRSINNLAAAYDGAGKQNLSLPLHEAALKLRKAKLGAGHPDTLATMNNLAAAYQAVGKLVLALPLYEQTLHGRQATLGADHPDTLTSMNNLGTAYQDAGKAALAIALHDKALEIQKHKLGADHPSTLLTMHNLAAAFRRSGKASQAVPLYEQTLQLTTEKLGAEHPTTLAVLNGLAAAYRATNKHELAVPLYEKALKLRQASLGADHPDTLTTMHNLASALQAAGKLDRAVRLYEQTLKLRESKLGADHPDTLATMNNLALEYQNSHKLESAVPLFLKAASGIEARGFFHEYAAPFVANLIRCYEKMGQLDQAEVWRRKWLAVVKQRFGAESPTYAADLVLLGMNLLKQKQWTGAAEVLRTALALRTKSQPNLWTTYNAQALLGEALLGQGRASRKDPDALVEAEPLLVHGYQGMKEREKTIPLISKGRLMEVAEHLVHLYETMDRKEEAKKWAVLLAELQRHDGKLLETVHDASSALKLAGTLDADTSGLIYQVRLTRGVRYVIDMSSPDPKALDPYLQLRDAAGQILAEDDDSGGHRNARLSFRPAADGVFRIRASTYNAGRGMFSLTIRAQE